MSVRIDFASNEHSRWPPWLPAVFVAPLAAVRPGQRHCAGAVGTQHRDASVKGPGWSIQDLWESRRH